MESVLRMSHAARGGTVIVLALIVAVTMAPSAPPMVRSAHDSPTADTANAAHTADAADVDPEDPEYTVEHIEALRVNRRMVVAAQAPKQKKAGKKIVIKGSAFLRAGRAFQRRPVVLQERRGKRWVKVARKRTKKQGGFAFRITSGSDAGQRVFRVRVPRARGMKPGRTKPLKVAVVPTAPKRTAPPANRPSGPAAHRGATGAFDPPATLPAGEPAPKGAKGDWTWLYGNDGGRWDACQVITWGYFDGGGYAGALADLRTAFATISARTGLMFRYVGTVSTPPAPGMSAVDGVDIVVGWSNASRISGLAGSVVGLASAVATTAPRGADVKWRLIRGWIALDTDGDLKKGYATTGRATWGQVMLHEALHALGLGHAGGAAQLMYGTVSSLNHRFGAGDLTGMDKIGSAAGCLT